MLRAQDSTVTGSLLSKGNDEALDGGDMWQGKCCQKIDGLGLPEVITDRESNSQLPNPETIWLVSKNRILSQSR